MNRIIRVICAAFLTISIMLQSRIAVCASERAVTPRKDKIVSELMADGVSRRDAEYYANLDEMIRRMEASGEIIDVDNVKALDRETMFINQSEFRRQVLNGNKAALKTALQSAESLATGYADIKEFMKKHDNQSKYVIVYPDGSQIAYDSNTKAIKSSDVLYASGHNYEKFGGGTISEYTSYTGYAEYTLSSAANYSKNRVEVKYNYSSSGAKVTYVEGVQSSYGIVTIANSNGGEISRTQSSYNNPAEANNQVIYQITGSIGAGFTFGSGLGLSVSITGGTSWTQTVYFRIYSNGAWEAVADTFT